MWAWGTAPYNSLAVIWIKFFSASVVVLSGGSEFGVQLPSTYSQTVIDYLFYFLLQLVMWS